MGRAALTPEEEEALAALLLPMQRPLEGLEVVAELRRSLVRIERLLVREARNKRHSWELVGAALGISRQAAHRRHARHINRTRRL